MNFPFGGGLNGDSFEPQDDWEWEDEAALDENDWDEEDWDEEDWDEEDWYEDDEE